MAAPHSPPRSAPTTPPPPAIDTTPGSTLTHFAHASIPYSAIFTNALMLHTLQSTPATSVDCGIRVLPPSQSGPENPQAASRHSLRNRSAVPSSSIDETTLPRLELQDLPLQLDDPRRLYTSTVPGVLLTHPGGFIEGGACTNSIASTPFSAITTPTTRPPTTVQEGDLPQAPTDASSSTYIAFLNDFLMRHPLATKSLDLQRAIAAETATQLEVLTECMRERKDAVRKNEGIEREIRKLHADRELERKIYEGLRRRADTAA